MCRKAHSVETLKAANLKFKTCYCPAFFDGKCDRGVVCNFIHHPHKVRKPNKTKKLSGDALICELEKLNPYGYGDHIEEKVEGKIEKIRRKRLEWKILKLNQFGKIFQGEQH